VVCIVGALAAVVALMSSGKTWEDLGKNHLLMDSDLPRERSRGASVSNLERDEDIRQMLKARNDRRIRRGEPPLDIERELAKLTAPDHDPTLRKEIRDLVIARNYRRTRAGKPALEVEAEVERELARLTDL